MPKRFEDKSLEEVYSQASSFFHCSITQLEITIIQAPSKGFLGFFSKNAIIEVASKNNTTTNKISINSNDNNGIEIETLTTKLNQLNKIEKIEKDKVVSQVKKEKIFDEFYDLKVEDIHEEPILSKNDQEIIREIKLEVNKLFGNLCYKIDEIEVSIMKDDELSSSEQRTVYIEFNGTDSALLIGKEGYRYKALSYILFNWINSKYNMMLRLEVAQFLKNQEEAMYNYLIPVIATIKEEGYFKTKILNGILIHIALTKLRDEFPDKYVAVKTNQKGDKYILVNEYRN